MRHSTFTIVLWMFTILPSSLLFLFVGAPLHVAVLVLIIGTFSYWTIGNAVFGLSQMSFTPNKPVTNHFHQTNYQQYIEVHPQQKIDRAFEKVTQYPNGCESVVRVVERLR